MMDNLQGKVALVTGSSRGIGRAIAVALARAGADLAINYRTRAADAKDAESEIAGYGRRCVAIQADVSLRSGVDRLVDAVRTELGHIDILVNNAGIARVQSIEEITEQDWDELLTVNLKSCFLVTQAVLPGMRARRWGRIINLSSVAAHVGGVVGAHYAASKAGMLGLTKTLAKEAAFILARAGRLEEDGVGITVNTVTPGFVATEMLENVPEKVLDKIRSQIPVGRLCHPEEIARVVHFLAADASAYITGQVWGVNGGLDM